MRPRRGFTLVEMLVAMALIIFIMVILTEAFTAGMESFRALKTIGDMNEKLRTAANVLRKDLQADHFDGRKRLSDASFWVEGPPREGFFRIWQGRPLLVDPNDPTGTPMRSIYEGIDDDGIPSYRATNHFLHFTVKLRANRRDQFASATLPVGPPLTSQTPSSLFKTGGPFDNLFQVSRRFQIPPSYTSQWYEVVYFLQAVPGDLAASVTQRYTLFRHQRLAVCDDKVFDVNTQSWQSINWQQTDPPSIPLVENVNGNNVQQLPNYYEVCCQQNLAPGLAPPGWLYFSSPMNLTIPQHRYGMDPTLPAGIPIFQPNPNDASTWTYPSFANLNPQNANLIGSDVLLSDVISFQVQIDPGTGVFIDLPAGSNPLFNSLSPPGQQYASPVGVFDTWTGAVSEFSGGQGPETDAYDYTDWDPTKNPTWQNGARPNPKVIPLNVFNGQPLTIRAVKITLRVWDLKTRQSRQITIIQDM
jgi:prepilin-type N-terminal cleavage/methylation domain-containing protein